jgi:2-polyprenyl-3-methyl-5-hydroxy-6-metoxy-1,4-benzoquinol methylase
VSVAASPPSSSLLLACPRCGGASAHALDAVDRNRCVSDERFEYRRCTGCGVLWLVNPPADLGRYYPDDYHEFLRGEALAAAAAEEAPRLRLITRHVSGGRLVEIGPSQGVFAYAAKQAGFDVVGLEMDGACCRHLTEEVGIQAINSAQPAEVLRALPPSRAIVMWHVIEHLQDTWTVVREIAANLEPGGVLALATPNPDALGFRLFRARWVHLDAPRHVTLIPLAALEDEAAKLGLRRVSATTTDPVGLLLNRMGWQRSPMQPPTLRPNPRFGYTLGQLLTPALRPLEERGMNGAAYTVVLQKRA